MPKERKGFNFYKSYFDMYNELTSKEDKLKFIDVLLKRQFYGTEPSNLKGMVKFAYISQKHSIDSQVNGFITKTKIDLQPPTEGAAIGGGKGAALQEKGEGKEKEQYGFLEFWNHYHEITNLPKSDKDSTLKHWKKLSLEEKRKAYSMAQPYFNSVEDKKFLVKARTFISNRRFDDEFALANQDLTDKSKKPKGMINAHWHHATGKWIDFGTP